MYLAGGEDIVSKPSSLRWTTKQKSSLILVLEEPQIGLYFNFITKCQYLKHSE